MVQCWSIGICILATFGTVVGAQTRERDGFGEFFGGGGRLLVDLEEVRKELGVNKQQAASLDALLDDLAEQRRVIREANEDPRSADETVERARAEHRLQQLTNFDRRSETLITVVLEPQQANRLSELFLQRDGIRAFERPEVATKLQLSDEQKGRLQSLRETFVENRPRRSAPDQQQRELREKEQEALRQLLNEEQQTLWQQLLGKPFDFSTIMRRDTGNR